MKKFVIIALGTLMLTTNVSAEEINTPVNCLDYVNTSISQEDIIKINEDKTSVTNDILELSQDIVSNIEKSNTKKEINITNDIILPNCNNYIYIRQEPNDTSKPIAKLYEGSAGIILHYENEWIKIKSGNIIGYVKNENILNGTKAQEYIQKNISSYDKKIYSNITDPIPIYNKKKNLDKDNFKYQRNITLKSNSKIYKEANLEADYTQNNNNINVQLLETSNNTWAKVKINKKEKYVLISDLNFNTKINKKSKATDVLEPGESYKIISYDSNIAKINVNNETKYINIENTNISAYFDNAEEITEKTINYDVGGIPEGKAKELIEYALQFLGNPYVWGGESLTNGCDCSGFTMLIYRHYGVSLPHHAASQANCGKEIPLNKVQPGDLIFYSNESGINHVGLYIGNNTLLHASNPIDGIKTSQWCYRTPTKAIRLIK